ncbi:unnamed protein product, partial [Discosporangium mesarthrocarpum]
MELKRYDTQRATASSMDMSHNRKGRCVTIKEAVDVHDVPSVQQTSYRKWAVAAGVPLSTPYLTVKRDVVKAVRRWIKSVLSEKVKVKRVEFVLGHVSRKGGTGMVVDDMYDGVHVDENWFYVTRDGARTYPRPDEDVPSPSRSPSKRFISKVMFLVAVAGPQRVQERRNWDG